MRAKDAVGKYGERVAVRFLADAGLTIIDRNWRCRSGEIDVVARDGGTLVFVEVKTRSSARFGSAPEAITPAKAARIRKLALAWLADRRDGGEPEFWPELRFDVVCVQRQWSGAAEVSHLRGVI